MSTDQYMQELQREVSDLKLVLQDVWAAVGDRLLAKGPLSKEYAGAITAKVTAALKDRPAPRDCENCAHEHAKAESAYARGLEVHRLELVKAEAACAELRAALVAAYALPPEPYDGDQWEPGDEAVRVTWRPWNRSAVESIGNDDDTRAIIIAKVLGEKQ